MDNFIDLKEEVKKATAEADKFYINENMQAAKRLFASLMSIERKCKSAREELSEARKTIRERREKQNAVKKM